MRVAGPTDGRAEGDERGAVMATRQPGRNGIQLSIGPEQLSRSERRVGDSGPRSTNAPGQAEQVNVRLETGRLEQNWSATDMLF